MQNAKSTFFTVFLIASLLLFAAYLYLQNYTNIHTAELKSGRFTITNDSQILPFPHLDKNTKYNLVLRFYKSADIDISNLVDGKSTYIIQTELVGPSQKPIKLMLFDNNKQPPGKYTDKYFEWYLTTFSYNDAIVSAKLTFKASDKFFDLMKKEIFIEKDYDPAARPFLILAKKALLYVSILLLIFAGSLWILKSRSGRGGN